MICSFLMTRQIFSWFSMLSNIFSAASDGFYINWFPKSFVYFWYFIWILRFLNYWKRFRFYILFMDPILRSKLLRLWSQLCRISRMCQNIFAQPYNIVIIIVSEIVAGHFNIYIDKNGFIMYIWYYFLRLKKSIIFKTREDRDQKWTRNSDPYLEPINKILTLEYISKAQRFFYFLTHILVIKNHFRFYFYNHIIANSSIKYKYIMPSEYPGAIYFEFVFISKSIKLIVSTTLETSHSRPRDRDNFRSQKWACGIHYKA